MKSITSSETAHDFIEEIENISQADLNRCRHCLCCSGGCPFSKAMDILPNAVIRMIQYGMKEHVLNCSTIYNCLH